MLNSQAGRAALTFAAMLFSPSFAHAAEAAPEVRRYVLIVASRTAPEEGVRPLEYADDDAAKYFELFGAAGAEVALLAVLDPDLQRRFPAAAAAAVPPTRQAVLAAARGFFARMRATPETRSVFYFVYSGHGGVGPNHEGYLTLVDGNLGRAELYREILAPSPATYNHLVLDACQSYFVVQKRGKRADKEGNYRSAVQSFLQSEDLASYPNTGVILAASSESETHEWSRWRAGVFSHELRSALMGAADLDGDGRVTYAEAASAVEAANAAIDNPAARLRVYARPPPARLDEPLVDLSALAAPSRLRFGAGVRGRYHVEDARGLRVLDLHSSGETAVEVRLLGVAPFYLRTETMEALVEPAGAVDVGSLTFGAPASVGKGAVEQSFRRYLYDVPFGVGFMRGLLAGRGPDTPGWNGWLGSAEPPPAIEVAAPSTSGAFTTWGLALVAVAAGAGVGAVVLGARADNTHEAYRRATEPAEARELKRRTRNEAVAANVLFAVAGAAGLGGGALFFYGTLGSPATNVTPGGGAVIGIGGTW